MRFESIKYDHSTYLHSEELTVEYNEIFNDLIDKVYIECWFDSDTDSNELEELYNYRIQDDCGYSKLFQFKNGALVQFRSCDNYWITKVDNKLIN